ncbi:fatty acid synthase S-acetyltransferase [Xylariomycetidae sp. FL2044]|nr:fatty acid synthase S-acetyltransferase [Xylariomycetidae sp. FL2044]
MSSDDIAIVGFSFVLPEGVETEEAFWDVLTTRKSLMREWPASRLNLTSFYDADANKLNKMHTRGAHFLQQDPGAFDAPFFSITPKEAAAMDPQQRLALETSYRAFENAGIPIDQVRGTRTAVFSGSFSDDYSRMLSKDPDNFPQTAVTGTAFSILANRVSWYFDLLGPSVAVDTACSSSLVAVDLACQSIRDGACSMALVTGANVILGPERSTQLSNLGFLSPDGVCYSFDHRANGYSRGEGIVSMVLKPVRDAVDAGDAIRAIIRSTGSNQDGKTPSLTQPSPRSQETLIRSVYEKAGLDFGAVRYFEAHGTGTPVGDPIEMRAIGNVFRTYRSSSQPLFVGSVKSNIGHLEGCSGLAGIMKAIMVVERGVIPPAALFQKINPDIDTGLFNIKIPTENTPWPDSGLRRVSVNSFGFGGTNAHVVLDDSENYLHIRASKSLARGYIFTPNMPQFATSENRAASALDHPRNGHFYTAEGLSSKQRQSVDMSSPGKCPSPETHSHSCSSSQAPLKPPVLLVWAASDKASLHQMLESYTSYTRARTSDAECFWSQLAFTLATRRSRLLWRGFTVVAVDGAQSSIDFTTVRPSRGMAAKEAAFIFTGQGAQYVLMGLELRRYPVFDNMLRKIDSVFTGLGSPWSMLDKLADAHAIDHPEYSQPLCTALQISLVALLESFNVRPRSVVGHSSGEIAAAYVTGAISLESACKIAYYRGQLAGKLYAVKNGSAGAMISVNLPQNRVQDYLTSHGLGSAGLSIACINSPGNCTLSGREDAVDQLKDSLDEAGIFAQKLRTGVAYHSPSMQIVASEYATLMHELEPGDARDKTNSVAMISSVTGNEVEPSYLSNPQYWVDNLTLPVKFSEALEILIRKRPNTSALIEVGPHPALRRPIQEVLDHLGEGTLADTKPVYLPTLVRSQSAHVSVLELTGNLFSQGHSPSIHVANQQDRLQDPIVPLSDCPGYPFNHSKVYWAESRLSRDYQHREAASDLLGYRVSDWNPLRPRWRITLNAETWPWISDHVVSGTTLFPGMGMVAMALEAVKHAAPTKKTIKGYYIKEAHFLSPVVISKSLEEWTELVTQSQPIQKEYEKECAWFRIDISTYFRSHWSDAFHATIRVDLDGPSQPLNDGMEKRLLQDHVTERHIRAERSCTSAMTTQAFYSLCADHGIRYGDSFQLLDAIKWDNENTAIARVRTSAPNDCAPAVVHPVILDSAIQLISVPMSKGTTEANTMIPYEIIGGWISGSGWISDVTKSLRYLAESRLVSAASVSEGSIHVIDEDDSILCEFPRFVFKSIGAHNSNQSASVDSKMLYSIDWRPHLSLLDKASLRRTCRATMHNQDEAAIEKLRSKLMLMIDNVVRRAYANLTSKDLMSTIPAAIQRYGAWMENHSKRMSIELPKRIDEEVCVDTLLLELDESHPPYRIFTEIARNLESILSGNVDPLQLVFDSGHATALYEDIFASVSDERFRELLQLIVHERPNLKILEVGAGTGSWTRRMLSTLEKLEMRTGAKSFSIYTYTDVSGAFFERAQRDFPDPRLSYHIFDLERPAANQGLDLASYDLIVAASVLHATSNLESTLRNIRTVAKPGAILINVEIVAPEKLLTNFAFGLLPGWWLSTEPWRSHCPVVDEARWDAVLKEAGFSGNDLVLQDYQSEISHALSLMVSTVVDPLTGSQADPEILFSIAEVVLIIDPTSKQQAVLAEKLTRGLLIPLGYVAQMVSVDSLGPSLLTDAEIVVSFVELDRPFLADMSQSEFESLKTFTTGSRKILWITSNIPGDDTKPSYGLSQGFLRSLRSEAADKRIITLTIETGEDCLNVESIFLHIDKVFRASFCRDSPEIEYVLRDSVLMSGRLIQQQYLAERVNSLTVPHSIKEPWGTGRPLKLSVGNPGILDSLQFSKDETYDEELKPYDVEIETRAWGLAFRDIFVALGRLDGVDLGVDCSGVVTRVGREAQLLFQPGDRVAGCAPGCMRTFARASARTIHKMADSLSFETAASVVNPGTTAYHCLINIARVRRGESILIHSAAGSTGQIAVQIATMLGATVFATVGSEFKKKLLVDNFGVQEGNIFYSRSDDFAKGVMRRTNGRGVDVVLNSLAGDGLLSSWKCVAPFGRFIEIGKADIVANSDLPMGSFARNVSFSAVDLHHMIETEPDLFSTILANTMALFEKGDIHPPQPLHIYSLSKVEDAFRYLQSGKNTGRIVLRVESAELVEKHICEESEWRFDENASYLIAGGLGGVGRTISRWMAGKGARHLILPSRSGPSSRAAAEMVSELERQGVKVAAPHCDISQLESISELLKESVDTMPPIKGCINASMALQDAVFDNMKYEQWKLTIQSKADTSWNLHRLFPDVDFFIQLSSLAGIYGSIGQSNYAAGCTFQDCLAQYRAGLGKKGVSLDLGWMSTSGVIAENERYQKLRGNAGDMRRVEDAELTALLDLFCSPSNPEVCRQLLVGVQTPADQILQGLSSIGYAQRRPLFAGFHSQELSQMGKAAMAGSGQPDAARLFRLAPEREARAEVVVKALAEKVARAIDIAAADVDYSKTLPEYGVDSLMAVELRNWVREDFQAQVAVFDIMGNATTIADVGLLIADRSEVGPGQGAEAVSC